DKLIIANGYALSNGISDDYIKGMVQGLNDDSDDAFQGKTIVPLDRRAAGGALYFEYLHDRPTNRFDLAVNLCTFLNNAAIAYGGAVALKEATVGVVYSTFKNNFAGEEGGACFVQNCNFNFSGCQFDSNHSDGSVSISFCERY